MISAISNYYEQHNSNSHGVFVTSQETDDVIDEARIKIANFLGSSLASTISFGQNMTTLNFLLAMALAQQIQPGDEIIVTDLDHDANVAPWLALEARGAIIHHVPLNGDGELDLDYFQKMLSPRTRLVAVGYASNALGTVNPLKLIRQWTRNQNTLMVVDAVHWAPHGLIDVSDLDPDFLLCSAYKFFGPHIGILYTKPELMSHLSPLKVRPQSEHAPQKIETGTLNHAAIAGVSAAVDFIASLAVDDSATFRQRIQTAMKRIYQYEHALAKELYHGLQSIPGVRVYGPPVGEADRTPTLSFTVDNHHAKQVAQALAAQDILAWDGDFYAIGVIRSLGLEERGGLVRLGLAPYNTPEEIHKTLRVCEDIARE